MKRDRLVLGGLAMGLCLLSASDGDAKARNIFAHESDFEAIVTHVDTSDNPGDTDMNVLLRPPSVEQAEVWFGRFWPYMEQEWVDDVLADVVKTSTFGASCKACAGAGPQGTACKIQEGQTYASHPCPRLFACDACLKDMERTGRREYADPSLGFKFDRADLAVKAEIFVNNPGQGWNDDNGTFREMKRDLGFPNGTCNEGDAHTVCGQRVWVSGWIATDGVHDGRPELHPVSAMIVDRGLSSSGARKLRIGSFIDGSTDSSFQWVPWMANYHDLVPMARQWRFDTSRAPFTQLFRPKPPTASMPISEISSLSSSALKSIKIDFAQEAACTAPLKSQIAKLDDQIEAIEAQIKELQEQRDHIGPDNEGNVSKTAIAREIQRLNAERAAPSKTRNELRAKLAACPQGKYRYAEAVMDFDMMGGSYWVGDVKLDWLVPASIAVDVKRFGNRAGYLSAAAPNMNSLPPPPVVRAIGGLRPMTSQCIVPAGTQRAAGLKRWYGWKVTANAIFENKSGVMTWQMPPGSVVSKQLSTSLSGAAAREDFVVWVPAPAYTGEIKASAKVSDGTSTSDSEEIINGAPRAWVDLREPSVAVKPDGRFYTAKVSAAVADMCGDVSSMTFTWTRDGAPVPAWKGPGPFDLTLRSGEKAKIEVVVEDAFGVEKAGDAQVVVAPELDVDATASCASTAPLDVPTPRGFAAPQIRAASTLCRETKLEGTARVVAGELAFPESSVGKVTYKWADLKVATEDDGWRWKPAPATWKVTYPDAAGANKAVLIAPDRPTYFLFQAAVSGTDQYGRTATDYVRGDNDFTPIPDEKLVLKKLWATWRPNVPMPDETAVKTSNDPLTRRFAAVLGQLNRAKTTDARSMLGVRSSLRQLRTYGFGMTAKDRNVTYTLPLRPVFSVKRTQRTNVEELNEAARVDLRRRVPQR